MGNTGEDKTIQKIEEFFKVPERVANQLQNIVEKVKGGYILIETRPRWDGRPGPWTKLPVAKMIFHKPSNLWKLYWRRASGKWELYGKYRTLGKMLRGIEDDRHGCFWG